MIDLIIPIYNAQKTLEKTLMSIKLQTLLDKIKIYLIDDCSNESYEEILNKYKDINITYKKLDKNKGPAVARQEGIDMSKSEYIMFIDADDLFYDADSIKRLYEEIIKGYDYVIGCTHEEKRNIDIYNESDLHGKIYRRSFIENNNIRFNETRFHEDNFFNNLFLLCEPKIQKINTKVYIYVNNEESITNTDYDKEFERLEILLYNMKELLNEAKKRKCTKLKVIFAIFIKIKYFNRIWETFNDEQKNIFINWIKKYNLNIEQYINNQNYEEVYEKMLKEYSY